MVASTCQIARPNCVALPVVNNLGCDRPVVPNPIPTSPFPIRAGGTRIRSKTIAISPISMTGPSGVVSESVVAVGITSFCKDKDGKG